MIKEDEVIDLGHCVLIRKLDPNDLSRRAVDMTIMDNKGRIWCKWRAEA